MIFNPILTLKRKIYQRQIQRHKLFFCINSGRVGSKYLSELLGTAKEVTSYHELEPKMIDEYLHAIEERAYTDSFQKRRLKSIAIQNTLLEFPPTQIYCETNHMFIKTFFDVIIEDFENIEIIILRRNLARVLKSFIECGYFSDKNIHWPHWMSSPNAITAAIPCIADDSDLDRYDRCIAYLIDIEARSVRFQQDYPHIKTHAIRLENLNDWNYIQELFLDLRITPTKATQMILGNKINHKDEAKDILNQRVSIEYCQQRIEQYIEKAKKLGIAIPETLAFP